MNDAIDVDAAVANALTVEEFFVPPPGKLRIAAYRDQGRWRVYLDRPELSSDRPIIEIHRGAGRIEVARNIRMRGGSWLIEVAGTVPLDRVSESAAMEKLLRQLIGYALTGTSRLAITSIETPHPFFAFGMLAYLPRGDRSLLARARELEAKLRAGMPIERPEGDAAAAVRVLFHHLALSPYTSLASNLVAYVQTFESRDALDLLGYMLRHLARHLNAFDLVRFHNLGANYPDALLLDALLRAFIGLADECDLSPLDRRALRQGWLARRRCEGLRVPDMPTSPGDNARELPGGAEPIPDVQITEPSARTKRLLPDAPAEALLTPSTRQAMRRAAADLESPGELIELGSATFLDRPLGATRRAADADRTPLLSYEAFSARLAAARLKELLDAGFLTDEQVDSLIAHIRAHRPAGWPVAKLPGHARQGVVSLEDAKKVGFDFVFTRATRSSLDALLAAYDFSALNAASPDTYQWMASARDVLLVRTDRATLAAFDAQQGTRFRLEVPDPARSFECGGIEYVEGLSAVLANGERLPIPPRLNE